MPPERTISRRIRTWVFGILIFLLAAAGGTVAYLEYFAPESNQAPIPEKPKKLINAGEKIIRLERREDFADETKNALAQNLPPGEFEVLLFSEERAGQMFYLLPSEFFSAACARPDQKILRAVSTYNAGVIGPSFQESKNSPFLILEVSSFEEGATGMSVWEKKIPRELSFLFPEFSQVNELEVVPKNQIIKNQDARVLETPVGKMFYVFFNRKLIIITE